ncbi:hypothetical protein BDE40_1597 [Litoreibacter halocynthiae]|uniref:Uncharacterized protein n=1 Tax=Litoreibacter halocynthiae TaxID=1242689 RepID=A0A4R7LGQ6_9RHOB|nr:hypothetical protein [Litoreibacter halocynthiae]TDT74878.1 hypothetical protein BDE40_1597 [Litoreibacter halocynthiae]
MGDFTTEKLYTRGSDLTDLLINAATDDDAFAALTDIHMTGDDPIEFKSYSYEQNVYLPLIARCYNDVCDVRLLEALNDYEERPCIVYRVSKPGHAQAVADLLKAIEAAPERLLPDLRREMEKILESSSKFLPAASDTSFMAGKHRETHAHLEQSVADFSLTGDVLRTLLEVSPEGGFYPGDGPLAVEELGEAHAPRCNLIGALGYSFGFLKTLASVYREAEAHGLRVLHLQVYGT